MNGFCLADQNIHWQGVDSTTPVGCSLASGTDQLGNRRVWLFRGETPADDRLIGSLMLPQDPSRPATAYRVPGGYMASGRDLTELLARLAASARAEGSA